MKKKDVVIESATTVDAVVETVATPTVETAAAPAAPTVEVVEKKAPGRPVVPGSKRQQLLAYKAEHGTGKKGRPIVEGSNRQIRLATMAEKREAGLLKRGRPKMDPAVKAANAAARLIAKAEALKTQNAPSTEQ
jgi:hypothetical protein